MRRNKSTLLTPDAMLENGVVVVFPIVCAAMYAASYHINATDKRLATSDRSLLLQIILFAFAQFLFGYTSGLVIMHMRMRWGDVRAVTKNASTTTKTTSSGYTALQSDDEGGTV